jgi:conjugative relaxase-like TrwC/TraI family protein
VLTVAKVTAGQADDYAEYLEAKSEPDQLGDYYLKDGDRVQAPGRWAMGGDVMGRDPAAPVDGEVLRSLMAVRRPDTGAPLRRAGGTGEAVAAIDATFSAPKSVSAVWALAAPGLRERIEEAHERAIDRALAYSLEHVKMVRERIDQQTVIHARARRLVATSWRHTTARSVGGQPPDPQLHSHVLLHGAIRGDGSVVAIDSRSWLVHRRELGAAYRTELAHGLGQLGFGTRRGTGRAGRYFEVLGVPEGLLDRWSSRHHQVHRAIQERVADRRLVLETVIAASGSDSVEARRKLAELESAVQLAPKVDRFLTTATRAAKSGVRTRADLDACWRATAREHRFDAGRVGRLRTGARTLSAASTDELLGRLTEFDATFAGREARAVALEASAGATIEATLERLDRLGLDGQLLSLADGDKTTRVHRAAEQQTTGLAGALAAARVKEIPHDMVEREARDLDTVLRATGGRLSGEQRAAIELACSDRQLVMIEGQAGTGKSTTLAAIARAHQAAGRDIVVTSTGGLAAERLGRELDASGVSTRAYSSAALHAGLEKGSLELTASSTLIHDEAALASTREQQQLLQAAHEFGARLIEVGDPRQSQPVGAGGLWSRIETATRENQARVELSRNVRAHDPDDRRDQRLFRDHEPEASLRGYAERERVHLTEEPRVAEDLALDAAQTDRAQGKRTVVIAQTTNEHLDELNARAQAIRHQAGELGHDGVEVPGQPYQLYPGDEVQIRHTVHHDELGALRNGTTARIADVDRGGEVALRLSDGRTALLDRAQIDQADIRLAYVQHPVPAQGQTTDTAHLIVAEHATQEGSYVALTRARKRSDIYAAIDEEDLETDRDQLGVLAQHMSRAEPEVPSIDTPLAHEAEVQTEHELELNDRRESNAAELEAEHDLGWEL